MKYPLRKILFLGHVLLGLGALSAQAQTVPVIITQPADQTALLGTSVSLDVSATGLPGPTYQWNFNNAALAGATGAQLVLPGVQFAQAGNYFVIVANSAGAVTSAVAQVSVQQAPVIVVHPVTTRALLNSAATLGAVALGTPAPQYQWAFDGVNLPNATNSTLTIANVQPAHLGGYRVTIFNAAGSVTSADAALEIDAASLLAGLPVINSQPTAMSVLAGANPSFSVAASGSGLSYQWLFNGQPMSGATGTNYKVSSAQSVNAGRYSVVVANSFGNAVSAPAPLAVIPFTLAVTASDALVTVGAPASFAAQVTGNGPFQFQWLLNGAPISGATAATYSLAAAQLHQVGNYAVRVTSAAGTVTSGPSFLTVEPLLFTTLPHAATVLTGSSPTLSVAVASTVAVSYQWFAGTEPLAGETNAALTLANAQPVQSDYYSVQVSNQYGAANSPAVLVSIQDLIFATQPAATTILVGGNGALACNVNSPSPVGYQWFFNGAAIAGATNATLNFTAVTPQQAGLYWVEAANALSTTTSDYASLTVDAVLSIAQQPASLTVAVGSIE